MTNLSEMTIEALYDMNFPFLLKMQARQELTADEQALHQQIIAEATKRHDALRQFELAERAERFAAQEQVTIHAVCGHRYTITDTNADEIADLKTQMCPGCIEEMIAFEQACEEEYQAQEDVEHARNGYGASCTDIEDPAVQSRLLALNAQRAQEDRETAAFYDLMAEAQ